MELMLEAEVERLMRVKQWRLASADSNLQGDLILEACRFG